MARLVLVALLAGLVARADAQAEVVVIGVQHATGQFIGPAMSPGHVRAALAAAEPGVVCIENTPQRFTAGHYTRATYEAQGIAVPWARARSIPVVAVDWIGDNAGHWAERRRVAAVRRERRVLGASDVDAAHYAYGPASLRHLRAARGAPDFARLNGAAYAAERCAWLDRADAGAGSAQAYIRVRDGHILERIVAASRAHPEARVAVVIGASHKGNLERRLQARGFTIVPVHASVPGDADDHLTASDAAAIVTTSLDTGSFVIAPERLARLVARLDAATDAASTALARYVRARRAMIDGDRVGATTAFAALAEAASTTRFPHPGYAWRLHLSVEQASRLELGRIADLEGHRDRALGHYRALLDTIEVPAYDERYESDFLYLARARNAVRGLLARPYRLDHVRRAPTDATVTADAGRSKRALELYRAKRWKALEGVARELAKSASARERYEGFFHLASAQAGQGRFGDASTTLARIDALRGAVPPNYWVNRLLTSLRKRVASARTL